MSVLQQNAAHDFLIRGEEYLAQHSDFKLVGRDEELNNLTAILARNNANNVLLVGAGGVGASAICLGLQQAKSKDDTPFDLITKRFFWLDTDGLFSSDDTNQINDSFKKTLKTLSRTPDSVLIIDDMKDFIEAARSNGTSNFINGLMHAVKQKHMQVIYETRDEDLARVLSAHSDMKEHYTLLDIREPSNGTLHDIVREAKKRLEKHHKISISEEAIDSAIDLTSNYRVQDMGLSRAQPERTLTLLDRALTTYKLEAHSKDPDVLALESKLATAENKLANKNLSDQAARNKLKSTCSTIKSDIQERTHEWDESQKKIRKLYEELRRGEEMLLKVETDLSAQYEKEAQDKDKAKENNSENENFIIPDLGQDSDEVTDLSDKIMKIKRLVEEKKDEFRDLRKEINDRLELCAEHVLNQFSEISGIPVTKLTQDECEKLKNLERNLGARVFGQDEAVTKLSDEILVAKAGLQSDNKPQASFLFLGPSGVGKTELAKALACELFDDESAVLRFDMSEYMHDHDVAKLIGAPPGYEGFEKGGILTNEMRKNPRRIILFDEVDKAHVDIFNIFLQILDDARLTDNRGLTYSFRDSIILMTSNTGSQHFLADQDFSVAKERAMEELSEKYRPEFLNRFNGRQNIVCFNTLDLKVIQMIAKREFKKLNNKLSNDGLSLSISDKDLGAMCKDHYDPVNGARGITGYIQVVIKSSLAKKKLFNPDVKGYITIEYDEKKKGVVIRPPKTDSPLQSFKDQNNDMDPDPRHAGDAHYD